MSNRQPSERTSESSGRKQKSRPRSPSEALEPGRAPARPKRKIKRPQSRRLSGFARFISGLFTLVLAIMVVAGGALLWLYHEFERAGPLAVSRTVGVTRGEGPIEIAARLERDGVITNRWAFVASHYMRNMMSRGRPQSLKAGEYDIKKSASMRDVLTTIAEGKSILSKITLPEGLTSAQIVERLMADESLTGDIAEVPPEGSLLPDTYRFSKGMSRQELVERMMSEQQRFLAAMWEKRQPDLPISTPEQALILASVVEKETGKADERQRVAAVFVNRLRRNMRLQSDPTIIYGIVGGKGSLGRPITRADIDGKTPYNTYHINGLPPGPICNPGRPAIEATLDPAKTSDLYFVADGSGGHAFSESLKEHNAAVSNWRKVEKQAREEAKQDAAATGIAAAERDTPTVRDDAPIPSSAATRAVSRPAPPPESATKAAATAVNAPAALPPALPRVTTLNAGAASGRAQPLKGAKAAEARPGSAVAEAVAVTPAEPAGPTAAPSAVGSAEVPVPVRKPKR